MSPRGPCDKGSQKQNDNAHFLALHIHIQGWNSWPRGQVLRGAIGPGEPLGFHLGTVTWTGCMRSHWSHSLPGHCLALCGRSTVAVVSLLSKAWLAPATSAPRRPRCCLVALNTSANAWSGRESRSQSHPREARGEMEWVKNIDMQKPLNVYQDRNGVPVNILGTGSLSEEGKG